MQFRIRIPVYTEIKGRVVQLNTCLPAGRANLNDNMNEYFTYVLRSQVDNRLYKGHTHSLNERVKEHNSGKTKSTSGYKPWDLVYFESFKTRKEAIAREKYFKSGIGREFLKTIIRPRGATE